MCLGNWLYRKPQYQQSLVEPLSDYSCMKDLEPKPASQVLSECLTHKNYERSDFFFFLISFSFCGCFKPLRSGVICYATVDNWNESDPNSIW